jgi:hypothetical protein
LGHSPDEKKVLKGIKGITYHKVSNRWMRPENQARNPELWAWSVYYGFHPGPSIPTEDVYKIYQAWIEKAQESLAPVNAHLKIQAQDPLGWQVNGIEEAKDIPVHPGVAKYLKEKGLWKDHWIIGKLDPGVQ